MAESDTGLTIALAYDIYVMTMGLTWINSDVFGPGEIELLRGLFTQVCPEVNTVFPPAYMHEMIRREHIKRTGQLLCLNPL